MRRVPDKKTYLIASVKEISRIEIHKLCKRSQRNEFAKHVCRFVIASSKSPGKNELKILKISTMTQLWTNFSDEKLIPATKQQTISQRL